MYLPVQHWISQVTKFWSMTLHCSDVGEPAEPKPQHFKCDVFFSLEILEIYVAIYFFKLLPFCWKGTKIVKWFYCGTEGITLALRGNNIAIEKPSRVRQGSRKLHWNYSLALLCRFAEDELWCTGGVRNTVRGGRKTRVVTFQDLKVSLPANLQNILIAKAWITTVHIILLSLIP